MGNVIELKSVLPGRLLLTKGTRHDYLRLERFHYRPKRPATWAQVWTIRYESPNQPTRLVAVGVLSYPTLALHARDRALGLYHLPPRPKIDFINRHIRTISRIAIHPTFRSLGLATTLVRHMIHHCPTRYVEALAIMGRAHPFFHKAGMQLFDPEEDGKPLYYLYDKQPTKVARATSPCLQHTHRHPVPTI